MIRTVNDHDLPRGLVSGHTIKHGAHGFAKYNAIYIDQRTDMGPRQALCPRECSQSRRVYLRGTAMLEICKCALNRNHIMTVYSSLDRGRSHDAFGHNCFFWQASAKTIKGNKGEDSLAKGPCCVITFANASQRASISSHLTVTTSRP